MSKNKKLLQTLLPLSIMGGGIYGFLYLTELESNKIKTLKDNGAVTVGSLYDTGGEHYKYKYEVDGREFFKGEREPYNYLMDTEQYKVYYSPSDPDYAYLNFKEPVFSDAHEYDETKCLSVEKTLSSVRFKYEVEGKSYTRLKHFEEGEPLSSASYFVKYRQDNPKIGYLIQKQ